MRIEEPYHEGEIWVQEQLDERGLAVANSGAISNVIPRGAISFCSQQPFIILTTLSRDGAIWTNAYSGKPGFIASSPDGSTLTIQLSLQKSIDPFADSLIVGGKVGAILIDLATRRRLRVNGAVASITGGSLVIAVEEGYPNCPKYIQKRKVSLRELAETRETADRVPPGTQETPPFGNREIKIISESDTAFVGTLHSTRGADASHRGGNPGFVEILNQSVLRIPDYVGNSMYNTLGNLHMDSRAALLFIDFESNETLLLSGEGELFINQEDPLGRAWGTSRFWVFTPKKWVWSKLHQPLKFELLEMSPFNP